MSEAPISVVMPVRNAGRFLDAAIASIITQTHRNLELIISDDRSSDDSGEIVARWARRDDRIRVVAGDEPPGPVSSSNRVARAARYDVVARMDADDIARPTRLAEELAVMRGDPEVVLVGSTFTGIDALDRVVRVADCSRLGLPTIFPQIAHGTIMYSQRAFSLVGGYRQECNYFEDVDLYLRLATLGKVMVLTRPLYLYRFNSTGARVSDDPSLIEDIFEKQRHWECRYLSTGSIDCPELDLSGRSISPKSIQMLALLRIWAGRRPHVLRRLFRRGQICADRQTLTAFLVGLVGNFSPALVQQIARILQKRRSMALNGAHVPDVVEWRPPVPVRWQADRGFGRAAS